MLVLRPKTTGIPETTICRILIRVWSFGPLVGQVRDLEAAGLLAYVYRCKCALLERATHSEQLLGMQTTACDCHRTPAHSEPQRQSRKTGETRRCKHGDARIQAFQPVLRLTTLFIAKFCDIISPSFCHESTSEFVEASPEN